jgi:hypothetical protein
MELIKLIINLITSFFQHKTEVVKQENKVADEKEEVIVQTIRANTNAQVVEQIAETQEAVAKVEEKQTKENVVRKKKPLKDQVNDQFGQDK